MKFYIYLFFFTTISFSQVGVMTTNPVCALDVNGWVKIGDQNNANGQNIPGSIRYNSIGKHLEIYKGNAWTKIGTPDIQTLVIRDGISNTYTGTSTNFTSTINNGTLTNNPFTLLNVSPYSEIVFLIEICLSPGTKKNALNNNIIQLNGNGYDSGEISCPSSETRDCYSIILNGKTTNSTNSNLNFNFTCNNSYNNIKITALIY